MSRREAGSATAELAVALPVVVLMLVAGVMAIATVTAKLGCVAAARDAVLTAARGGQVSNAQIGLSNDGDEITATVRRPAMTCTATALREPGLA